MQKRHEEQRYREKSGGRVLARVLADDLRAVRGGLGAVTSATGTITDLGDRYDYTVRGGDGDSAV
jgi:hypothetical protein